MRFVLTIFIFFQSLYTYSETLQIVSNGGYQGIVNDRGDVVIPAVYEALGWTNTEQYIFNESIGYQQNGYWGLIDIKSKKITGAKFDLLKPFDDNYFEAGIRGKFSNQLFRGLIDRNGKTILSFNYLTIEKMNDDLLLTSEFKFGQIHYGVYSLSRHVLVPMDYLKIEQLDSWLLASNRLNKIQVYNQFGKAILKEPIDAITASEGNYLVENDGKFGLIDNAGEIIYESAFKQIQPGMEPIPFPSWNIKDLNGDFQAEIYCDSITLLTKDNLLIAHVNEVTHLLAASTSLFENQHHELKYIKDGFLVTLNKALGNWDIYKTDGSPVATGFETVRVDSSYFYARQKDGWEAYNFFGRRITSRHYQDMGPSQGQNIPVKKNGYWGWIDFQGQTIVQFKFDSIVTTQHPNRYLAKHLGEWGIADFDENWLVLPRYNQILAYKPYFIGQKGLAYHLIDDSGTILSKIPFDLKLNEGLITLHEDGLVGLITRMGAVIDPMFDTVKTVGDYYVLMKGNEASLIDQTGKYILSSKDAVSDVLAYSEDYFQIIKDGKHGFVDTDGKLRIANRYDNSLPYQEGLAAIQLLGKWGFINPSEILVIQPYYRQSSNFRNGLAIVEEGDQYGIITPTGEEVIEPAWKLIERLSTGNYRITDWDGKQGMANDQGQFVIRPNYDHIEDTHKDLLIISQNGTKGMMDYRGYQKLKFEYSDIQVKGDYLLLRKTP